MSAKPYLQVTSDFTKEFNDVIKKFKRDAVLVGIPEEDTKRDEDAPINNATLLAINNFGSPANNIPPRPVMEIGIRKAQPEIIEEFRKGAKAALKDGLSALSKVYNRVGMIAANSIKKAINSQEGIDPPTDATLAARKREGFAGTKSLIVTGQMRNAITYVVKGEEGKE
jgi:hypothetical protein